jgi:hypothetical protein
LDIRAHSAVVDDDAFANGLEEIGHWFCRWSLVLRRCASSDGVQASTQILPSATDRRPRTDDRLHMRTPVLDWGTGVSVFRTKTENPKPLEPAVPARHPPPQLD